LLVAAALALAALTLLAPWALAFDPWAWVVWGRSTAHLALDTAGGPSWKPLPVVLTTPFSLAGAAAPALWLVVARAGGLLALAGAGRLAWLLAGRAAAVVAVAALAVSEWWLFNTALGNSEGLLAALVLWAAVAHLDDRPRVAALLGLLAALLRPEAALFLAAYAAWQAWAGALGWRSLAAGAAVLAIGWVGPDVVGAGGALGASRAARGTASPQSAVNAAHPALQVLADFGSLLGWAVGLAALAGLVVGDARARALAAAGAAWVLLVAVMTQAGYAGNPRYNVAPAAIAAVLAGIGAARLGRGRAAAPRGSRLLSTAGARPGRPGRAGRRRGNPIASGRFVDAGVRRSVGPRATEAPVLALVVVVAATALAFTTLRDQVGELGRRADRRTALGTLVSAAGGAPAIRACAPIRTNQPMKAMVAWRLDVPLAHLADRPRAPAAILRAPAGYASGPAPAEPATPARGGFAARAAAGPWRLVAACR
jgi:hypothetical protein